MQTKNAEAAIPYGIRVTAALCWRLLVIVGALIAFGLLMRRLEIVMIPVAVAALLAALLAPAVSILHRHRVPRGLATAIVLISGLAILGGVLTFVVNAFINGLPDLQNQLAGSLDTIRGWLVSGPLHLSQQQIDQGLEKISSSLRENQTTLTAGAVSTATTVTELLGEVLLTLFVLIFFLYNGQGMWNFLIGLLPRHLYTRVDQAGRRGFATLVGFVRATVIVAVVDAVGIGIGLWIIGIPLKIPLAALVFLGAFIPIMGSLVAGLVAVLVALVTNGAVPALIILGVVVLVMQLESHVLQPFILGRAVQIHPVVVVLGVAAGLVGAGIVGALLAVPIIAVLNSAIRSFVNDTPYRKINPEDPTQAEPPEN